MKTVNKDILTLAISKELSVKTEIVKQMPTKTMLKFKCSKNLRV